MSSLEKTAKQIFSNPPLQPNSCSLIASNEFESDDAQYAFEMILTLFMEGMMIFYNNLENVNITDITYEHLTALNQWFYSLGIKPVIKENYDENYYCKIILKNDPEYHPIFIIKEIEKNYHFFFNPKFVKYQFNFPKTQLNKINALFIYNNKTFTISFTQY